MILFTLTNELTNIICCYFVAQNVSILFVDDLMKTRTITTTTIFEENNDYIIKVDSVDCYYINLKQYVYQKVYILVLFKHVTMIRN